MEEGFRVEEGKQNDVERMREREWRKSVRNICKRLNDFLISMITTEIQ